MVTKFEIFIQDILQELEEAAEEDGSQVDDEELEAEAEHVAEMRFDTYFRQQLEELPYPPRAVVFLSRSSLVRILWHYRLS